MNGLWFSFGAVVLFICTIESSQNLKILFTLTAFLSDLERCELFFGSNVQHYRSCLFGLLAVSRLSSYLVLIARLFPFKIHGNLQFPSNLPYTLQQCRSLSRHLQW
jgi:hypothetical protein